MADIVMDGNVRLSWLTAIANTDLPTTTELNGGIALESWVTPDGLGFGPATTGKVDTTAVNSVQNTTAVGRRDDGEPFLIFKNQGYGAAPYTTFAGNPSGFIVVRRGLLGTTAWTSGQKIQVYPCQAGYRSLAAYAANSVEKFTVPFEINGIVKDAAAVA